MKFSWLRQFTSHSFNRTKSKTCVICCGPKKSGTFLMHTIVKQLNIWHDIDICYLTTGYDRGIGSNTKIVSHPRHFVKKLRNGQFVAAHLPWSRDLEEILTTPKSYRNIKFLFIYRDPRDSIVSFMNRKKKESENGNHNILKDCKNDNERLDIVIKYWNRAIISRAYYSKYKPWLKKNYCHSVKFEDIYPEILDLKSGVIGEELKKLFKYLDLDETTIIPDKYFNKVFNTSFNASNEINKIGQYKRYFNKGHYSLLNNDKFRDELRALKYKW